MKRSLLPRSFTILLCGAVLAGCSPTAPGHTTATPVISAVSPNVGSTAGGGSLTIMGSGFEAGAVLTFDGTPVTAAVNSSISVIVPKIPARAAGPVDVLVTNPSGSSAKA